MLLTAICAADNFDGDGPFEAAEIAERSIPRL